jgi:hypothetical protein
LLIINKHDTFVLFQLDKCSSSFWAWSTDRLWYWSSDGQTLRNWVTNVIWKKDIEQVIYYVYCSQTKGSSRLGVQSEHVKVIRCDIKPWCIDRCRSNLYEIHVSYCQSLTSTDYPSAHLGRPFKIKYLENKYFFFLQNYFNFWIDVIFYYAYCRVGFYLLDIDRVMIDSASHLFKNLGLSIWAEFCIGPQQMDNRFFFCFCLNFILRSLPWKMISISFLLPKWAKEDFMVIPGNGVIWVEISKVLIQVRHDGNIKAL